MLMKKLLLIIVFTGCFLCTACGSSAGKFIRTIKKEQESFHIPANHQINS